MGTFARTNVMYVDVMINTTGAHGHMVLVMTSKYMASVPADAPMGTHDPSSIDFDPQDFCKFFLVLPCVGVSAVLWRGSAETGMQGGIGQESLSLSSGSSLACFIIFIFIFIFISISISIILILILIRMPMVIPPHVAHISPGIQLQENQWGVESLSKQKHFRPLEHRFRPPRFLQDFRKRTQIIRKKTHMFRKKTKLFRTCWQEPTQSSKTSTCE